MMGWQESSLDNKNSVFIFLFFSYLYFLFFRPRRTACGILVPRPGIHPSPPALGVQSGLDCQGSSLICILKIFYNTHTLCL